jgi:hypothetical protein
MVSVAREGGLWRAAGFAVRVVLDGAFAAKRVESPWKAPEIRAEPDQITRAPKIRARARGTAFTANALRLNRR